LTHNFGGWIVGSAADPNNTQPRDYDVVVPHSRWNAAAFLIPLDAKVNTFGGWKVTVNDIQIDVWPGELSWIMDRPATKFVWNPMSGARFSKLS
jgi:hypothetical protein